MLSRFLTVLAALALVLAACSSEPETTAEPERAPTTVPAVAADPTAVPAAPPTPEPTAASEAAAAPEPTPAPTATATPDPVRQAFLDVPGIVDPTNFRWPREVEGLNGVVSVPAKPDRIITASIGHDEMTLAIVPNERLVAVGGVSKIGTYSNVADFLQDKPEISRDPETIIVQAPDVVVTSPFFNADGIEALTRVGIPVIQTELHQSPESRIAAILLMGYIYGEEERAVTFANEIRERYDALVAVTGAASPKPRVLVLTNYSDSIWVAGAGSTEGGVIEAAGGINAAAEAGVESNQTTSLEGVISMAPDVIVIPQPVDFGAEEFMQSLLGNEALAEVPAIKNGAVHVVESKHYTTLSFWNILGAESLARLLWPAAFSDPVDLSFSMGG